MPAKPKSRTPNVTAIKSGNPLVIETWQLHDVKPYEKNARKIPPAAVEKVAESLKEFGWRQPMVVDSDGVLIVGHARRLGAVHLGWTEGPVHVARDLSPAQIKAYRLMDNRSHQEADWDLDILKAELFDMEGLDIDLSLTGFNDSELARFLNSDGENDPLAEWSGMPSFDQPDATAFRSIIVHFQDQAAVDDFVRMIGQPLNTATKFIWHPTQQRHDFSGKGYMSNEPEVPALHSVEK